jgi:hypothetical protein
MSHWVRYNSPRRTQCDPNGTAALCCDPRNHVFRKLLGHHSTDFIRTMARKKLAKTRKKAKKATR